MGLQSWAILMLITDLLPIKFIPKPQYFPQAFCLFLLSSVPSSSPLASQHQENDNTLSFTQPTPEEKSNLQLSHIICSRKEEKLDLPKTSARFHSHSPSQYTFPFILFLFFISLCISSFSLVYICSTLLHTKNNLFLTHLQKGPDGVGSVG